MLIIRQLHRPSWIGIHCANTGFQPLGMGDNSLEVFDSDTYTKLLLHDELIEIQRVNSDRGAQGMFKNVCQI